MGREEPPDLAESGSHDRQSENKPDSVDTLRDLIAGPQLTALNTRLDDPVIRAREVARVLPEAVRTSAAAGDQISKVLRPAIEASIKSSVRKNPHALVDAIFPVMGPALRKAVAPHQRNLQAELHHILVGVPWNSLHAVHPQFHTPLRQLLGLHVAAVEAPAHHGTLAPHQPRPQRAGKTALKKEIPSSQSY